MLYGFQQYLVSKGVKRTCKEYNSSKEIENYESLFISTYNPAYYTFTKENKSCCWGLSEYGKPPVLSLGFSKMFVLQNLESHKTYEDGYRILFSKWGDDKFDEVFDVFISENKYFEIDCKDEKNISIKILSK